MRTYSLNITQKTSSPFGSPLIGRSYQAETLNWYRYSFNGKENQDKIYGDGNAVDFGDRIEDSRLGKWLSLDKAKDEYPYLSAYVYCNNNPIVYIDPDGKRFYFAAGAANDPDKTGYPKMILRAFQAAGITRTILVNAHGNKSSDVKFTMGDDSRIPSYKQVDYTPNTYETDDYGVTVQTGFEKLEQRPTNWRITRAVDGIKDNLKKDPLAKGEQFNLSGYSTGSVIMAQAALILANEGKVIDNLVLIGTPISEDSELWKELKANKNIKNIIRKDIPGDDVAKLNKGGSKFKALINFITKGEGHPHFKYAFGKNAKKNSEKLGKELYKKGVR